MGILKKVTYIDGTQFRGAQPRIIGDRQQRPVSQALFVAPTTIQQSFKAYPTRLIPEDVANSTLVPERSRLLLRGAKLAAQRLHLERDQLVLGRIWHIKQPVERRQRMRDSVADFARVFPVARTLRNAITEAGCDGSALTP